jgi:hypothetical protein
VTATVDDLIALTKQFEVNRTTERQLVAPLTGVQLAQQMHNPRLKAAFVNTYVMLVDQQRGRTLTSEQADTLISLARAL